MSIKLKANSDGTSELLNNADTVLRFGSDNYPYDKDGERLGISELADSDGAGKVGFLQAGTDAVARTVQAKLRDVVSVKDFGAVSGQSLATADALPDSYPAFQAMINHCISIFYSGEVYIESGYYRLSQPLDLPISITLVGKGSQESYIHADHLLGPAIRFRKGNSGIKNLGVTASASRRAGAYGAGNNFGVLFEGDDVPENGPGAPRLLHCFMENFYIYGHPQGLVHVVGPAFTGRIVGMELSMTKGHGLSFDRGESTGRTNVITSVISGVCRVGEGRISNCGGHAIACGLPTSNFSTPSLRVIVDNIEGGNNSTDAAVRFYNSPVYLRGANYVYENSGLSVNTGGYSAVVAGRNIHLRNNRMLGDYAHAYLVTTYDELPTDGVYIDGMSTIAPLAALDPAVLVSRPVGETSEPQNIHIFQGETGGIAKIIGTDATMGLEDFRRIGGVSVNGDRPVAYKRATTTINNSASATPDPDLRSWLLPDELVYFEAVLEYDGTATADIRVAVGGPGGSTCRYSPVSSVKTGTTDTAVVQAVSSSNVTFGSGAIGTSRIVTLQGFCQNGSTAGYLTVSWGQLVAEVSDTRVFAGISHLRVRRVTK